MPDEADPPRKHYGFKPREFERANEGSLSNPLAEALRAHPVVPTDPAQIAAAANRIDLRDLVRAGAGQGAQLGSNQIGNRENEVHAILKAKYAHDQVTGQFELGVLDDSKRRRRIRNYWIGLAIVDIPLGLFAWWIGPDAAIPFVCAIAAIGMFTARQTWETFFLRTHY